MKIKMNTFVLLAVACITSTVCFANYDEQCLRDCFSTGHECKYCAWQCYSDRVPPVRSNTNTPCPLDGYENNN